MVGSVEELSQQFGHSTLAPGTGYSTAMAGGGVSAPKSPGFFSNLGHSLVNAGTGIGSAVYHATVDPFAHLISNAGNSLQQGPNSGIDQQRQALDARSHQLFQDYVNHKITKSQYASGASALQPKYNELNSSTKANTASVKSTAQMLPDAAQAALTVATLGSGGLEAGAAKAALERAGGLVAGAKGAKAAGAVGKSAEDILGVGKKFGSTALTQVPGKIIRNAALVQPTAQMPGQVVNDVKTGNVGNLALDAAVPLAGAAAGKIAAPVVGKIADLFRSDHGIVNGLQFKDGTIQSVLSDLQAKAAAGDAKAAQDYATMVDQAKVAVDHMNAEGHSPEMIAAYQRYHNNPTENMTVKEFLQQNHDLAQASNIFQGMAKKGQLSVDAAGEKAVPKELVGRVGAGKFDQTEKADLIRRLSAVSPQERGTILAADEAKGLHYTQNPNVLAAVKEAAINSDPAIMAKQIQDVTGTRALPASKSPTLNKLIADKAPKVPGGYIPIIKPEGSAGFNAATSIDNAVLDTKRGVLAPVTDAARKVGLSLGATNPVGTKLAIADNFANELDKAGVQGDSEKILKELDKTASQTRGAFDARALTKGQIDNALRNVAPEADSGAVRKAYSRAIAQLPASQVGLGQSVVNKTIGRSTAFNQYMKAQAIGRYELNPIFWAKQDIKGGLIAGAEGAKLGIKSTPEDMLALKKAGLLSDHARGGSDMSVVGDTSGSGNVSQLMRGNQQKIAGWLASSIADAHGTTVSKILAENGPLAQQMKQSLSLVHSYGEGGYLNSPFAKTLNLMVFPSRFTTKVGIEAAKALNKMPVTTQIATLHSIGQGAKWAGSPEGQQWQKDNSELVGLIKYFTPVAEVGALASFLDSGFHAGDLGQLGGLPVGVLNTMLEHQGVDLGKAGSSQYVDPKTGQPIPDKIPQTTKARMQQGLADLFGSLFSYPGRTAGLPSKNDVVQLGGKNPVTTPAKGEVKPQFKADYKGPAPIAPTTKAIGPQTATTLAPTSKPFTGAPKLPPIGKKLVRAPKTKTFAKKLQPF